MSLTIEKLTKYALELQKQFEAASAMMHQALGALNFVHNQINELKNPKEEPKNEQINSENAQQTT